MKVNNIATTAIVSSLIACGQVPSQEQTLVTKQQKTQKDLSYQDAAYLTGYLANAFDVVVDGKRYADTEDYYTQKLEQLMAEAEKSGYAGWTLSFDAEIGLEDLKYGMMVFASSAGNRGFAGQIPMDFNGSFQMEIPDSAREAVYSVRANKKINLTLTPPEDGESSTFGKPIRWCYNFSAQLTGITLGSPVILNSFESRLTKYACSLESSGIEIPATK